LPLQSFPFRGTVRSNPAAFLYLFATFLLLESSSPIFLRNPTSVFFHEEVFHFPFAYRNFPWLSQGHQFSLKALQYAVSVITPPLCDSLPQPHITTTAVRILLVPLRYSGKLRSFLMGLLRLGLSYPCGRGGHCSSLRRTSSA